MVALGEACNTLEPPVTEILSLLSRIAMADRAETVWALATAYFGRLGFARANYGFTRFRSERSIGDPDDALFLTTCDAAFVAHYFRGNFYARTPVFRWAAQNQGARTWGWVAEALASGRLTPDEVDALRENAAIGVVAGVSISFPDNSMRAKGALGLIADAGISAAQVDAIWAQQGAAMDCVAHMMHLKLIQFPIASKRRPLTARQAEALEWVADGKNAQDVALLMGVSAAMVEKHLRLARDALQVDTTAQAVAKAALLNLIFQRRPLTDREAVAAG